MGPSTPGRQPRRPGAAEFTTWAARRTARPCLRHNPIRTIVRMVSRIGRQAGLWPKRPGVVLIIARVALAGAVAGRRGHPMIAMQASRIGKQVGLWPRKRGAAGTRARVARLQAVVRRLGGDCIELEI